MKKIITDKIERLLSSLYGDPIVVKKTENKSSVEKTEGDQRRCKNLPFEFIRLLF
jgi:hypothetical protein